jgi:hypothetical protein
MTDPLDDLRILIRHANRSPQAEWAQVLQTIVKALQDSLTVMDEEVEIDGFVDTFGDGDGAILAIVRDEDRRPALLLRRGESAVEIAYGNTVKLPGHGQWDFVESSFEGLLAFDDVTEQAVIRAVTTFVRRNVFD